MSGALNSHGPGLSSAPSSSAGGHTFGQPRAAKVEGNRVRGSASVSISDANRELHSQSHRRPPGREPPPSPARAHMPRRQACWASWNYRLKETPEEKVFETIYHEFPGTFTTNLDGSRKMLQLGVGVSTQYDDTVMMNVESHQLALRSVILGVISNFTEEDVKGATGRDKLASALRDAINTKLEALENFGGVEEVHFTSFVLQ